MQIVQHFAELITWSRRRLLDNITLNLINLVLALLASFWKFQILEFCVIAA